MDFTAHDRTRFALRCNAPAEADNAYDTKLAVAYTRRTQFVGWVEGGE